MIRPHFIAQLLLSLSLAAQAQENLIRNWSFEEIKPDINGEILCAGCAGCVNFAKHWNSAHGSVDYFNACSNENWPLWGVPSNYYGFQEAHDGLAYAAIATYYDPDQDGVDFREHLWHHLAFPLEKDKEYKLTYWVSLCDSMEFATNGLGALFTPDDPRSWPFTAHLDQLPQIEYLGPPITNKTGWTKIEGSFIAQGDELYISIGCFRTDTDPLFQAVRVADFPSQPDSWDGSGYYIDAVELYEISGVGMADQLTINNGQLTIWPNPATAAIELQWPVPLQQSAQLLLHDAQGRAVLQMALPAGGTKAQLNVAHLPPGLYVAELRQGGAPPMRERVVVVKH